MWNEVKTALYEEPHATALKKLFAAALLRNPDNAWNAAREVEEHPGRANFIATRWIDDETVLAEKGRLLSVMGPIAKVPTKEEFAAELYRSAGECKSASDKLSYLKFFSDVMGFVERGTGNGVTVNLLNQQKTMIVPVAASDEEWEIAAVAHQKRLAERHG